MRLARGFAIIAWLIVFGTEVRAQTLRVAAAADLQYSMKELSQKFEKQSGIAITVTYGSSGNFRAQVANGAPFDVFFSADAQYPQQLVEAGLADGTTKVTYAIGHLVLWAPKGENLELAQKGFDALKEKRVTRISIANPEHAPYGRAAVAALQKAGVYEQVKSKLVYGDNISQAAQFVQSGSAQVGILALSVTFAEGMKDGERWLIPEELYPTIRQEVVIVNASKNKAAAQAFVDFVTKSEEGQKILSDYGLTPPGKAAKP